MCYGKYPTGNIERATFFLAVRVYLFPAAPTLLSCENYDFHKKYPAIARVERSKIKYKRKSNVI